MKTKFLAMIAQLTTTRVEATSIKRAPIQKPRIRIRGLGRIRLRGAKKLLEISVDGATSLTTPTNNARFLQDTTNPQSSTLATSTLRSLPSIAAARALKNQVNQLIPFSINRMIHRLQIVGLEGRHARMLHEEQLRCQPQQRLPLPKLRRLRSQIEILCLLLFLRVW